MPVAFISVGTKGASASATSRTVALQASNPGDWYFVMFSITSNATISTPSGWTKLFQVNSGASFTTALYSALSTGSNANPVFSWTGATANTGQAFLFAGADTVAVGAAGGQSSGTTNPHTSASFTSTAPNSLAVAFDFQSSATAQPNTPAGWTLLNAQGGATSAMAFAAWSLQLGGTGSTSGAISQAQTAVAWVEGQFELLEEPLLGQICI